MTIAALVATFVFFLVVGVVATVKGWKLKLMSRYIRFIYWYAAHWAAYARAVEAGYVEYLGQLETTDLKPLAQFYAVKEPQELQWNREKGFVKVPK